MKKMIFVYFFAILLFTCYWKKCRLIYYIYHKTSHGPRQQHGKIGEFVSTGTSTYVCDENHTYLLLLFLIKTIAL